MQASNIGHLGFVALPKENISSSSNKGFAIIFYQGKKIFGGTKMKQTTLIITQIFFLFLNLCLPWRLPSQRSKSYYRQCINKYTFDNIPKSHQQRLFMHGYFHWCYWTSKEEDLGIIHIIIVPASLNKTLRMFTDANFRRNGNNSITSHMKRRYANLMGPDCCVRYLEVTVLRAARAASSLTCDSVSNLHCPSMMDHFGTSHDTV